MPPNVPRPSVIENGAHVNAEMLDYIIFGSCSRVIFSKEAITVRLNNVVKSGDECDGLVPDSITVQP